MWAVIGGNMYPLISASQVNNPGVYVELIGRKAIPDGSSSTDWNNAHTGAFGGMKRIHLDPSFGMNHTVHTFGGRTD